MKRTGYRHVIADLAFALKMNYAFGAEFIEIDPIALGTEQFEGLEEEREALKEQITIEPGATRVYTEQPFSAASL